MRVVAGIHKGRQLKAVPGSNTRPTTDKVKEAVFQMLGPFFEGGRALDLFAGSGSLGIEALSRGMDSCIFVDKHSKAIQTIRENVTTLKLEGQVEIFRVDAFRALSAAAKRGLMFDLIFIDPPYGKINYQDIINIMIKENLLQDNAIIYCEHDMKEELLDSIADLSVIKRVNYGGTIGVTIYKKGY